MTYSKLSERLELARRLELMFVTAILSRSCVELPRRHRMLLHGSRPQAVLLTETTNRDAV